MSETRVPPSFNGDELRFQVGLADNSDISEKNTKARARNTGDIRFMTNLLLFHFHRSCMFAHTHRRSQNRFVYSPAYAHAAPHLNKSKPSAGSSLAENLATSSETIASWRCISSDLVRHPCIGNLFVRKFGLCSWPSVAAWIRALACLRLLQRLATIENSWHSLHPKFRNFCARYRCFKTWTTLFY
jgi:hypothetical protein